MLRRAGRTPAALISVRPCGRRGRPRGSDRLSVGRPVPTRPDRCGRWRRDRARRPLGLPVVPDVKMMSEASSPPRAERRRATSWPCASRARALNSATVVQSGRVGPSKTTISWRDSSPGTSASSSTRSEPSMSVTVKSRRARRGSQDMTGLLSAVSSVQGHQDRADGIDGEARDHPFRQCWEPTGPRDLRARSHYPPVRAPPGPLGRPVGQTKVGPSHRSGLRRLGNSLRPGPAPRGLSEAPISRPVYVSVIRHECIYYENGGA